MTTRATKSKMGRNPFGKTTSSVKKPSPSLSALPKNKAKAKAKAKAPLKAKSKTKAKTQTKVRLNGQKTTAPKASNQSFQKPTIEPVRQKASRPLENKKPAQQRDAIQMAQKAINWALIEAPAQAVVFGIKAVLIGTSKKNKK